MSITAFDNRRSYSGNGATTSFAFPVPFILASDLKVILRAADGREAPQILAADYTVTGAGNATGGSVVFSQPPPTGTTIVIYRDPPLTQPINLLDGGPLPAPTANGAFDRLTMQVQRVYEITTHALKLKETDIPGSGTFEAGGSEIVNIKEGSQPDSAASVRQLLAATPNLQAYATAAEASASAASSAASQALTASQQAAGAAGAASASAAAAIVAKIAWRGAWAEGETYAVSDGVQLKGSAYLCRAAHIATVATAPATGAASENIWDLLAAQGAEGVKGPQGPQGPPGPNGDGSGNVTGPNSATDGAMAVFDGSTGRAIREGAPLAQVASTGQYGDLLGAPVPAYYVDGNNLVFNSQVDSGQRQIWLVNTSAADNSSSELILATPRANHWISFEINNGVSVPVGSLRGGPGIKNINHFFDVIGFFSNAGVYQADLNGGGLNLKSDSRYFIGGKMLGYNNGLTGFGNAAALNAGTAPSNVVQLTPDSRLPRVNGSNLDGVWQEGSIWGLTLLYTNATAITIDRGSCRNEDGWQALHMGLGGQFAKLLSNAWAPGHGQGGLDAGTVAVNTWYHVHLIRNDSNGSIDALLSKSAMSPAMPANYSDRRRLGSIKTDAAGQIIPFAQVGDKFCWWSPVMDASVVSNTSAAQLVKVSVPPNTEADLTFAAVSNTFGYVHVSSPLISDSAPSPTAAPYFTVIAASGTSQGYARLHILTDSASLIKYRNSTNANTTFNITTHGWIDTRGKK